jgi:hypothetical protein
MTIVINLVSSCSPSLKSMSSYNSSSCTSPPTGNPKNGWLLHTQCTLSLSLSSHTHTCITESKQPLHKSYLWGFKSLAVPQVVLHILFLAYAIRCCVLYFRNLKVEALKRKEKKRKTGKKERVWCLEGKS